MTVFVDPHWKPTLQRLNDDASLNPLNCSGTQLSLYYWCVCAAKYGNDDGSERYFDRFMPNEDDQTLPVGSRIKLCKRKNNFWTKFWKSADLIVRILDLHPPVLHDIARWKKRCFRHSGACQFHLNRYGAWCIKRDSNILLKQQALGFHFFEIKKPIGCRTSK